MERALYIFDLDGVIYRGNTPQPFASETIERIRREGSRVFFLTNNASLSRKDVSNKLTRLGVPASPDEVMTSSFATGLWFREHGAIGKRVMIIGEKGCYDELSAAGMQVFSPDDTTDVDFVVVGIDRSFNYHKLNCAQQAILKGATFIATNRDPTYPREDGVSPGGGSIVAAVATASGREPITIGKPETYTIRKILDLTGVDRTDAVMVGDRLDTDILVGNRAGVHTLLVLGGVCTREEAEEAQGDLRPGGIIENLGQLR
ncbi:MAG: acid sugar phosphatase [Armatimonadota bacterium]|nr:MAG: acid sugar phosphatase [Armatimonadota bacterium]